MKKKLLSLSALLLSGMAFSQTTILLEDFESGLPGTWSQTTNSTDGGWLAGTATTLSSQYWAISTANATDIVATNDDQCNCDKSADRLMSPTLNLSTVTAARLSVDIFFNGGTYQGSTEIGLIEISTNGGSTWTTLQTLTGAADWYTNFIDLSAYVGQSNVKIAFHYNDDAGWLFGYAIDNFYVYEPAPVDVEMTSLNVNQYVVGPGSSTIAGTITNLGSTTLTSVVIDWNDGTPHPQTFTVSIAPMGTYNFTHGTTLSVAAGTNYNIDVTATAAADAVSGNNMLSTIVYGLTFMPTTKVVGEEGTGTWCGWCPRGAVYMGDKANTYPSTWVGIAVHNADPMTVTAYDAGVSALISGYPSGLIDRIPETDPMDFEAAYLNRITVVRPADVAVTNGWNSTTRVMNITVTATFAASLTGINMRLAAVVVEDNVTGTASTYDQTNYYSSTSQNIALSGAGHNWQTEPNPVPAANMEYDHVARALLPSFAGQASSVPTSVTAGGTATFSFNYTVPATQDETQMKVIGLLIDQASGEIVNANEGQASLGVAEQANDIFTASLYPNPANELVTLNLNIKESNDVSVEMYNIAGALVNSSDLGTLNGGNRITLNASNYEAGIYTVHINVGGSVITQKLVITH